MQNDLSMTDLLLGPNAATAATRTSPYVSKGVAVTTTDLSTQLIIEDFGKISTNALGNPTNRFLCNNQSLPGIWEVTSVGDALMRQTIQLPSWQWIHMNVTKGGDTARWETVVGSLSSYSDFSRICVDLILDSPPVLGTYVRFPQDVSLTFGFNLSSGSYVSKVAGRDFVFPNLQVGVLVALCVPLSNLAAPIQAVSAQVNIPLDSTLSSTRVFMDRVRLEKMAMAAPPPAAASSPLAQQQSPQGVASPVLQPSSAQAPTSRSRTPPSLSRSSPGDELTSSTIPKCTMSILMIAFALFVTCCL